MTPPIFHERMPTGSPAGARTVSRSRDRQPESIETNIYIARDVCAVGVKLDG